MVTAKISISLPVGAAQIGKRVMSSTSIVLSVALLVSCATSFRIFDKALPLLNGQNINKSIDYLGIPDNKYRIDDREIYVWSTAEDFTYVNPVTTNTQGYAGTTPFSAYSTSYESHTSRLYCEIKMSTKQKIVERIEYRGNNRACKTYAKRLKLLLKRQTQP
jgi:hypothetical protein